MLDTCDRKKPTFLGFLIMVSIYNFLTRSVLEGTGIVCVMQMCGLDCSRFAKRALNRRGWIYAPLSVGHLVLSA